VFAIVNAPAALRAVQEHAAAVLAERFPGAHLGVGARVDARLRVVLGPLVVPASRPGAPPVLTVREIAIRPRWRALLGGHVEPAAVALSGVDVEAGPGLAELAELPRRLRPAAATRSGARAPDAPVVSFAGARLRGTLRPGIAIDAGPFEGRVQTEAHAEAGGAVTLRARLPGGGWIEARADAPREQLSLRVEGARADALAAMVHRRVPLDVRGLLWGDVSLTRRGGVASGPFTLRVDKLVVSSARLGATPVGPLGFTVRGDVAVDPGARSMAVEGARLEVGADPRTDTEIAARLALLPEPRFALSARAEAIDFEALARALPSALAPGDDAPRVAGTFGFHLAVEGPVRRPAAWTVDAGVDLGELRRAGATRLDGSFTHRAQLTGGRTREVVVGPSNPRFVPIGALPKHVVRAVTVSEDAGFYAHRGFDFREVGAALADGARRGRVRGASTISQQVAKNLFLTPERTLSRKLREALVTLALEASLRKQRILELYLNVAEWGPGIVGIGDAANHYFGKDARDLTPREAAFLATIIPNPVRYHVYFARGALSPAWDARVDALLLRLRELDVIDDAQLAASLGERLVFAGG
jgi:hypothetical protein